MNTNTVQPEHFTPDSPAIHATFPAAVSESRLIRELLSSLPAPLQRVAYGAVAATSILLTGCSQEDAPQTTPMKIPPAVSEYFAGRYYNQAQIAEQLRSIESLETRYSMPGIVFEKAIKAALAADSTPTGFKYLPELVRNDLLGSIRTYAELAHDDARSYPGTPFEAPLKRMADSASTVVSNQAHQAFDSYTFGTFADSLVAFHENLDAAKIIISHGQGLFESAQFGRQCTALAERIAPVVAGFEARGIDWFKQHPEAIAQLRAESMSTRISLMGALNSPFFEPLREDLKRIQQLCEALETATISDQAFETYWKKGASKNVDYPALEASKILHKALIDVAGAASQELADALHSSALYVSSSTRSKISAAEAAQKIYQASTNTANSFAQVGTNAPSTHDTSSFIPYWALLNQSTYYSPSAALGAGGYGARGADTPPGIPPPGNGPRPGPRATPLGSISRIPALPAGTGASRLSGMGASVRSTHAPGSSQTARSAAGAASSAQATAASAAASGRAAGSAASAASAARSTAAAASAASAARSAASAASAASSAARAASSASSASSSGRSAGSSSSGGGGRPCNCGCTQVLEAMAEARATALLSIQTEIAEPVTPHVD